MGILVTPTVIKMAAMPKDMRLNWSSDLKNEEDYGWIHARGELKGADRIKYML